MIGRLDRGESTAIVGQPHTGKTSLLQIVQDGEVQSNILGSPLEQTSLRYIDSQMFGPTITQNEFWDHVLGPISIQIQDENVQDLYEIAKENQFGTFTLETFFEGLEDIDWKVGILLDEFESILSHPVLNSTEFYGSLRSLASRFSSLGLIIATRRSLNDLNVDTQELNPHGSPYFNTFTELRIGALPQNAADDILAQDGVNFTKLEREFVLNVSGRHPFLLQLTGALLWDHKEDFPNQELTTKFTTVANEVYDQTDAHFHDTWRSWSNAERKVITAIALAQIPTLVAGHEFKWKTLIQDIDDFSPELRGLKKDGTVIETEYDSRSGWAITQDALLWWLADTIKRNVRDDKAWNRWIEEQEFGAVLTKQERSEFDNAAKSIGSLLGKGATTLIEAFAKGMASGWAGSITGS